MSSQTKLIKDIFSIYDTILENKNVSEATDVYDNVDFKDGSVKNSYPSRDNINTALLSDIEAAAKTAGVKVDITTAISGHESLPSRHPSGNAVDIAIINGKNVSLSNRGDADKFVAALVSMGYSKNEEGSSNPKAVLTFGFKNHDNHVHVSNTTSSPSNTTSSQTTGNTTTSKTEKTGGSFAREIGKSILNAVGINEEKLYSSFGVNPQSRYGTIVIPKENNLKIKSPVDGKITNYYSPNCENQIVIEFDNDGKLGYLEYCGITTPLVQNGEKVNKGTVIGKTDSDVSVSLYNSSKTREHINPNKETILKKKSKDNKKEDDEEDKKDIDSGLSGKNEYSKLFIKSYRNLKKSFKRKDPKKLDENIERIKSLLK